MYYSLLRTLNSKLDGIQELVPIEKNFENLQLAFNNEINGEILKLQNNVIRIQSYPTSKVSVDSSLSQQKTKAENQVRENKYVAFIYIIIGIGIATLFIFILWIISNI